MKEYTLLRSARKTLSLEVGKDLRPLVRAPRRLPREEIDRFVGQKREWLRRATEQKRRQLAVDAAAESQKEALLARARAVLPVRTACYSQIMGLRPAHISITSAKTRFGSCSGDGRLCFSWRLMLYPPEAVDYVVVHELAHIRCRNHGKAFYRLVAGVLPDHEARRALLRSAPCPGADGE